MNITVALRSKETVFKLTRGMMPEYYSLKHEYHFLRYIKNIKHNIFMFKILSRSAYELSSLIIRNQENIPAI